MLAMTWLVYAQTGSAFDIALLGVAGLVPRATFGLFAGALADRFPRLRLMIIADGLWAMTLIGFTIALLWGGFSLPIVLAVTVVLGIGQSLFRPALNAYLPTAIPPERLGRANGLMTAAQEATTLLGSPLGGALIALVGAALAFAFNAGTYVISGLLIAAVAISLRGPARTTGPRPSPPPFLHQFAEGVRYLRGEGGLLKLTVVSFGANFFLSLFATFLVLYVGDVLHQGAVTFGLLSAAAGAGFATGSLLVGPLRPERRFGFWFAAGWGPAGFAIAGLAVVASPLLAGPLLFGLGVAGGFGNTTFFTGVQKYVPNELLGRYLSLDEVGSLAASPAGQLGGGLVIAAIGVPGDFVIAAIGTLACTYGLLLFRDVRSLSTREVAARPLAD